MRSLIITLVSAIVLATPVSAVAATTTEGGSTQVKAQEACMNQWLFNGVWRTRVTNLEFVPKDANHVFNEWAVTISFANGTSVDTMPAVTGLNEMQLGFPNGDTIGTGNMTITTLEQQKLTYHSFPVSGQFTYTQHFGSPDLLADPKPTKLLITFPVADYRKMHPGADARFWTQKTPAYNYRFKLDCTK